MWRLTVISTLFGGLFCVAGCSGGSGVPVEQVKVNGMTPGEYLDSHDAPAKAKGARSAARPNPR